MLLAEELLLQVTQIDGSIVPAVSGSINTGLAGALLSELALLGKVTIDAKGKVRVPDPTPVGNVHLDAALAVFVQHQGKRPKDLLARVAAGDLRRRLYEGLAASGDVRQDSRKVLLVFTRTKWPLLRTEQKDWTWRELSSVLLGSSPPTARTGALVALLYAVGAISARFKGEGGLSTKDLKKRAKAIAEGNWAGDAVGKAIADAQAAITAATIASVTAAGAAAASSGSS